MKLFGRIAEVAMVCALPLALGCNTNGAMCPNVPIPADQSSTFMSKAAEFPIPVRIDAAFSADERAQALQAVAVQ